MPSGEPGSAQVKSPSFTPAANDRHCAGVSVSTGPSGSLLSRTAMTPGTLVATSTQLPPEPPEKLDLRHSARSRSALTGDLPWQNRRSSRARHQAGERRHAAGRTKDHSGPPHHWPPRGGSGPALPGRQCPVRRAARPEPAGPLGPVSAASSGTTWTMIFGCSASQSSSRVSCSRSTPGPPTGLRSATSLMIVHSSGGSSRSSNCWRSTGR